MGIDLTVVVSKLRQFLLQSNTNSRNTDFLSTKFFPRMCIFTEKFLKSMQLWIWISSADFSNVFIFDRSRSMPGTEEGHVDSYGLAHGPRFTLNESFTLELQKNLVLRTSYWERFYICPRVAVFTPWSELFQTRAMNLEFEGKTPLFFFPLSLPLSLSPSPPLYLFITPSPGIHVT